MGIFIFSLPSLLAYFALLLAGAIILHDIKAAAWGRLRQAGRFSAWCILVIALPLLWRFSVPISANGLSLHLLGAPLFVLMFGRQLAMAGIAISVAAYTFIHHGLWMNLGMNLLLLAVVPVYCGDAVMRATRRFLPRHVFIFLLGNGFFGAMLILAITGLASLLANSLLVSPASAGGDTIAYMLLLAWGESFLTGFLLTMFTVYQPQWVLTFDDEVYLQRK